MNEGYTRFDQTLAEWQRGSGGDIGVQVVLRMLHELRQSYGDDFNPQLALEAIENLAETANEIAASLKNE